MRWNFVIPDPDSFPSGGNIYNRKIVDALIQQGEDVFINPLNINRVIGIPFDITVWDTIYLSQMSETHIDSIPGKHLMLIHHLQSMYPGPTEIFEQMEMPILSQMDAFWVTSNFSKDYLRNRNVTKPIWVIPPIFNGPTFNNPVEPSGMFKGLIAANLVERKGILPFLKLLPNLRNIPKFKIYITGNHDLEPEYANECVQYVSHNQLRNRIQFLGPIPRMDLFHLYYESDLYISTSFFETFGMSIQEALYYGTPVLALSGGNTPYLVGSFGWCVDNTAELVDLMRELIRQPYRVANMEVTYSNWVADWIVAAEFLIKKVNE